MPMTTQKRATQGEFSRALLQEIAEQRRLHGYTQEDIATAINKTQPYVSTHLDGQYPWSTQDLDALAALFDMDVFEFIESARRHVGTHPVTPLSPNDMTAEQIESLPNTAVIPRKKPISQ